MADFVNSCKQILIASFNIIVSGLSNKIDSPFANLIPALLALAKPALYPMSCHCRKGNSFKRISLLWSLESLSTIIHSKFLYDSKAIADCRQSFIKCDDL